MGHNIRARTHFVTCGARNALGGAGTLARRVITFAVAAALARAIEGRHLVLEQHIGRYRGLRHQVHRIHHPHQEEEDEGGQY